MARSITLEQGAKFTMGKGDSRHLVSPDVGAHQITMNYSVFQPGQEFPQHLHDVSADIFIVLKGGVSVRQGDSYTPIVAGDFAYIPPGEVHGTVNQTDAQAILISFQSPPDVELYRGERDPAVTGSVPKPPPGHISKVQIRQLTSGDFHADNGIRQWASASPAMGAKELILHYYELDPGRTLAVPAAPDTEAVWFVQAGNVLITANGEALSIAHNGVLFVPSGENQVVQNSGDDVARLIRCQST